MHEGALTVGGCICPSLIYMHWGFFEPSVGFAIPQVEAPSDHCVCSLHSLILVEH